jgi:hypothetical protein
MSFVRPRYLLKRLKMGTTRIEHMVRSSAETKRARSSGPNFVPFIGLIKWRSILISGHADPLDFFSEAQAPAWPSLRGEASCGGGLLTRSSASAHLDFNSEIKSPDA